MAASNFPCFREASFAVIRSLVAAGPKRASVIVVHTALQLAADIAQPRRNSIDGWHGGN